MTIVFVRGTSGSGKSTLVREIMSGYTTKEPEFVEKRKQPWSYTLTEPGKKPLYVLGHYEVACGGCDTLPTLDIIFNMIKAAHADGKHVIAEGMLLASDVKRAVAVAEETNDVLIVSLTTPIDQCCDNIRTRRALKGNDKELNETNTRNRHNYEQKQIEKLKAANVDIRALTYDGALETIRRAFN
jgi:guanylate kinase